MVTSEAVRLRLPIEMGSSHSFQVLAGGKGELLARRPSGVPRIECVSLPAGLQRSPLALSSICSTAWGTRKLLKTQPAVWNRSLAKGAREVAC